VDLRLKKLFFGGDFEPRAVGRFLDSRWIQECGGGFLARLDELKEELKSFSIILILNSEAFIVSIRNAK